MLSVECSFCGDRSTPHLMARSSEWLSPHKHRFGCHLDVLCRAKLSRCGGERGVIRGLRRSVQCPANLPTCPRSKGKISQSERRLARRQQIVRRHWSSFLSGPLRTAAHSITQKLFSASGTHRSSGWISGRKRSWTSSSVITLFLNTAIVAFLERRPTVPLSDRLLPLLDSGTAVRVGDVCACSCGMAVVSR